jgi:hypothetical protein
VKLPNASSFVSFILYSIFHASHGKDTDFLVYVSLVIRLFFGASMQAGY